MSLAEAAGGGAILSNRRGAIGSLSDYFWRRPGILIFLLLLPAVLWLGIVYLGSLLALLLQSFFAIDEFSGVVDRSTLTLKTYAELLRPENLDIIIRTVLMAASVTVAAAIVAFPIAYFAARYAKGKWKALFYLGVMLPLWASYLVKIYAWKLILAKEGILNWVFAQLQLTWLLDAILSIPIIGGNSLSISYMGPSSSSFTCGCPTWCCRCRRRSSGCPRASRKRRATSAPRRCKRSGA
jgi:putative spermidine/putrescine transport system permease protein